MKEISGTSEGTKLYQHHLNAGESYILFKIHNDRFSDLGAYWVSCRQ